MHHARLFDSPRRLVTLVGLTLALATTATAQVGQGSGGKVFGLVGGSFGDGGTAVSTSGGGGIGRLSEDISFDFDGRNDVTDVRLQIGQGIGCRRPLILPPDDITQSETGLILTVEGGLDVLLWKGFSIGADARWLRLLVDRGTFDFAQVTSRVSVRF